MHLEDLKPGVRVRGLAGAETAEVVSASWFGDQAVDVVFRINGRVDQRIVYRTDEPELTLAESGRAFSFDGDGETLDVTEVRRLKAEEKLGPMAIARRLGIGRASVYRALAAEPKGSA